MKKIIFLLVILFLWLPKKIYAQNPPFQCAFQIECVDPSDCKPDPRSNTIYSKEYTNEFKYIFDLSKIPQDYWDSYPDRDNNGIPDILESKELVTFPDTQTACNDKRHSLSGTNELVIDQRKTDEVSWNCKYDEPGEHTFHLLTRDERGNKFDICIGEYYVIDYKSEVIINVDSDTGLQDVDSTWTVNIDFVNDNDSIPSYWTFFDGENCYNSSKNIEDKGTIGGLFGTNKDSYFTLKPLPAGVHLIELYDLDKRETFAMREFTVLKRGEPTPTLTPLPSATPTDIPECTKCEANSDCSGICTRCAFCKSQQKYIIPPLAPLCERLPTEYSAKCWECVNQEKIFTAIGCLPTDLSTILREYVFTIGIGFAGAIAFLYFLWGAFQIMTSAGNAERVTQAREIMVSAISGLLLIIFSVMLLRVIGVEILQLPGFE